MRWWLMLPVVLGGLALNATGCDQVCTYMGCVDRVVVNLSRPLPRMQDIRVDIVTDGYAHSCLAAWPPGGGATGGAAGDGSAGAGGASPNVGPLPSCNSWEDTAAPFVEVDPFDEGEVQNIAVYFVCPEQLEVTISDADGTIATGSFRPDCTARYPNGQACDVNPVCWQAQVMLDVP
jgi:hypothetical protein